MRGGDRLARRASGGIRNGPDVALAAVGRNAPVSDAQAVRRDIRLDRVAVEDLARLAASDVGDPELARAESSGWSPADLGVVDDLAAVGGPRGRIAVAREAARVLARGADEQDAAAIAGGRVSDDLAVGREGGAVRCRGRNRESDSSGSVLQFEGSRSCYCLADRVTKARVWPSGDRPGDDSLPVNDVNCVNERAIPPFRSGPPRRPNANAATIAAAAAAIARAAHPRAEVRRERESRRGPRRLRQRLRARTRGRGPSAGGARASSRGSGGRCARARARRSDPRRRAPADPPSGSPTSCRRRSRPRNARLPESIS